MHLLCSHRWCYLLPSNIDRPFVKPPLVYLKRKGTGHGTGGLQERLHAPGIIEAHEFRRARPDVLLEMPANSG